MDERRELSYTPARAPQTTVYHSLTVLHLLCTFGMQKTWLGFSVLTACRVFIMGIWLRWLRCGAVFPLRGELLNANGIFVIIRQSSCSRRSNHHCHLASLLKLWCYNEEAWWIKPKQGNGKCSYSGRKLSHNSALDLKLSWLVWSQKHIVKLTSAEPGVCGEQATG